MQGKSDFLCHTYRLGIEAGRCGLVGRAFGARLRELTDCAAGRGVEGETTIAGTPVVR